MTTKPRRRRPEAALQKAVVEFLYAALPEDAWFTAINALPMKGIVAGVVMKAMGQRAGVPDILIIHKGRACWVELKAPKGTLSNIQCETAADLIVAGCHGPVTCRSVGEVAMALAEWNIPCKARVAA